MTATAVIAEATSRSRRPAKPAVRSVASRLTLPWPRHRLSRALTVLERSVAAVPLVLIGLIHLSLAPDYLQPAAYVGVLFLLSCAGVWTAAVGISAGIKGAWLLGAGVAGGMFAGLVLASTVGLPQFRDSFAAPLAVPALVLEGLVVAVYAVAGLHRRTPLGA